MINCKTSLSTLLLLLLLLSATLAQARTCNSGLPSHLYDVNDNLSLGAEFRAFYMGASLGENMPQSEDDRVFKNNYALAARAMLDWYIVENLTFLFEGEWRFKFPGWEEKFARHNDFRLNQLLLEYDPEFMRLIAGVQSVSFGSTALLDQVMLGVTLGFRFESLTFNVFGGVANRNAMRNASNSMFMAYTSYTNGWKLVSENTWENYLAGLDLTAFLSDSIRLNFLYLLSWPELEPLRSHSFAINFDGSFFENRLSTIVEAIAILNSDNKLMPALVVDIRGKLFENFWLRAGTALAFNYTEEELPSPVFENLSWGLIQRFNLHQGKIARLGVNWQANQYVNPFADYYMAFLSKQENDGSGFDFDTSDELDVGVEFNYQKYYKIKVSYAGMNLFNAPTSSHMVYLALRIILGGQFND